MASKSPRARKKSAMKGIRILRKDGLIQRYRTTKKAVRKKGYTYSKRIRAWVKFLPTHVIAYLSYDTKRTGNNRQFEIHQWLDINPNNFDVRAWLKHQLEYWVNEQGLVYITDQDVEVVYVGFESDPEFDTMQGVKAFWDDRGLLYAPHNYGKLVRKYIRKHRIGIDIDTKDFKVMKNATAKARKYGIVQANPTNHGWHIKIFTNKKRTFESMMRIRANLGDDPKRIAKDKQRYHKHFFAAFDVLFDKKVEINEPLGSFL